jgi:hypothetical protein
MAMFETKIQFKGKERTIRFGSWVTSEFQKLVRDKGTEATIELFAYIIFFGIIQGEGLRAKYIAGEEIGFDVFDCYDWIDEQGGLESDEVERIQNLYVKHNETNVPKNQKATTEKAKSVKTK